MLHTSKELHPNHDNETFSTRNRHVIIKYHESIWLLYRGFGNAVKFQYQLVSRRPSCLIMSGHMTSGVSSHSVLLLYVFDDLCNFPVLISSLEDNVKPPFIDYRSMTWQSGTVSGNHQSKKGKSVVVLRLHCEAEWRVDFIQCWQENRGRWNIGHFAEVFWNKGLTALC